MSQATDYTVIGRQSSQTSGLKELMDFTTFTGANVVATFNNHVQVTLEGITCTVRRETVPLYTMGSPNPRSFAKGKRVITGSMIFSMFDRDELLYSFYPETYGNFDTEGQLGESSGDSWDPWDYLDNKDSDTSLSVWIPVMNHSANAGSGMTEVQQVGARIGDLFSSRAPHFLDELPPFNVTLTMVNEMGMAAQMRIMGVVIINESHGYSVNTQVPEKTCAFLARDLVPLHPIDLT